MGGEEVAGAGEGLILHLRAILHQPSCTPVHTSLLSAWKSSYIPGRSTFNTVHTAPALVHLCAYHPQCLEKYLHTQDFGAPWSIPIGLYTMPWCIFCVDFCVLNLEKYLLREVAHRESTYLGKVSIEVFFNRYCPLRGGGALLLPG